MENYSFAASSPGLFLSPRTFFSLSSPAYLTESATDLRTDRIDREIEIVICPDGSVCQTKIDRQEFELLVFACFIVAEGNVRARCQVFS